MATASTTLSSSAPLRRHTGSELLLQKLPLYGRAKQYIRSDISNPYTEGNTLSYGPDRYLILEMVRECRSAALLETQQHTPASTMPIQTAGGSFYGIQSDFYETQSRRQWERSLMKTDGAVSAEKATGFSQKKQLEEQRAAQAKSLESLWEDEMVALPLQEEVLEPLIRPAVVTFETGMAGVNTDTSAEKGGYDSDADSATEDAKKVSPGGGDTSFRARKNTTGRGSSSIHQTNRGEDSRKDAHGDVAATAVSAVLRRIMQSTPEERAILTVARQPVTQMSAVVLSTTTSGDVTASAAAPPSTAQWGASAMQVVNVSSLGSGHNSSPVSTLDAKTRQCVSAYLKRVGWIEQQRTRSAGARGGAAGAAWEEGWASMSPAQRVRLEMSHTSGERTRFHRRRKTASGAGDEGGGRAE